MAEFKITVLPGDGIGPEIMEQALKVLQAVGVKFGHRFAFTRGLIGGSAYDAAGHPLPKETLDLCRAGDAIMLGAVGGPKWDSLPVHLRPEAGALLPLRKELGLYANLRPATVFPALVNASTLKPEVVSGLDVLVIRELTGGLYFGEKRREPLPGGGIRVIDTLLYTTAEIERIARLGFEMARKRRGRLTSVDKANVLESSRHWREVVNGLAPEYPGVELDHMYVDNCAMQIVRAPGQFDVIVTENTFGDIISDEISMVTGSLGMLPSASLGGQVGLYEPIHGSAPDIAGQNKANPIATVLSAAMMLKYSLNLDTESQSVNQAVAGVLDRGYRTADLMQEDMKLVSTIEMGDLIAGNI